MQITSVTSPQVFFPVARSTASPVETSSSDQVVVNVSPDKFSNFVQEAGAQPEVRQDVVDEFRAKIASGHYPSTDIVAGLSHLLGASLVHMATAADSEQRAAKN